MEAAPGRYQQPEHRGFQAALIITGFFTSGTGLTEFADEAIPHIACLRFHPF